MVVYDSGLTNREDLGGAKMEEGLPDPTKDEGLAYRPTLLAAPLGVNVAD